LIADFLGADGFTRRVHNAFRVGDARTAEFLHDQWHDAILLETLRSPSGRGFTKTGLPINDIPNE
jgi:hypothetical protein